MGQYTTTGEGKTPTSYYSYSKSLLGFIGRDYKKFDQLVNLQILNPEYLALYYELKRYDKQQIFTLKESVHES